MEVSKEVRAFLDEHDAKMNIGNSLTGRITYNKVRCSVNISVRETIDVLEIRPLSSLDDIGSGAGAGGAIYKEFKKKVKNG